MNVKLSQCSNIWVKLQSLKSKPLKGDIVTDCSLAASKFFSFCTAIAAHPNPNKRNPQILKQ